jgi:hypothetical protein
MVGVHLGASGSVTSDQQRLLGGHTHQHDQVTRLHRRHQHLEPFLGLVNQHPEAVAHLLAGFLAKFGESRRVEPILPGLAGYTHLLGGSSDAFDLSLSNERGLLRVGIPPTGHQTSSVRTQAARPRAMRLTRLANRLNAANRKHTRATISSTRSRVRVIGLLSHSVGRVTQQQEGEPSDEEDAGEGEEQELHYASTAIR